MPYSVIILAISSLPSHNASLFVNMLQHGSQGDATNTQHDCQSNPSLFSSTTPVPGTLQNSTTNSKSSLIAQPDAAFSVRSRPNGPYPGHARFYEVR
mmetsp:Transcript_6855/g.14865  ORF Transcript_6855/g.14865 Transcript_6855/m.14865 type:complete len:97 (+) Transcript_6855:99-389(+)